MALAPEIEPAIPGAGATLVPMLRSAVLLSLCSVCLLAASGPYAPANPRWNRPAEPFRIVGNLYYVGASDVSAFLIATPAGHILLDTGFRETVPIIEKNLEKLGFHLADIRLVLALHAHYDHAGGIAEIKARSKARFLASPADAPQFSRGGTGDFAFGNTYPFPPVSPDGLLREGVPVGLGGVWLTPHFTPGHTPGCTSWSTTILEGPRSYRVVVACSLTAPGYRLVGNLRYPDILRDFESSFAKLRALPCDIFLTEHGWDFDLDRKKRQKAQDPARNPFVDPEGYLQYLDRSQAAFRKQAAGQRR